MQDRLSSLTNLDIFGILFPNFHVIPDKQIKIFNLLVTIRDVLQSFSTIATHHQFQGSTIRFSFGLIPGRFSMYLSYLGSSVRTTHFAVYVVLSSVTTKEVKLRVPDSSITTKALFSPSFIFFESSEQAAPEKQRIRASK